MTTIPARIIPCECGKLITLDTLTILGAKCPKCGRVIYPTERKA